jgi:hypothetical protein
VADEREEPIRFFEPHEMAAVLEHDVVSMGDAMGDAVALAS